MPSPDCGWVESDSGAGRNINCHDRLPAVIDCCDGLSVEALDRRLKSGAQDRIDNQFAIHDPRQRLRRKFGRALHAQRLQGKLGKHRSCVAFQIGRTSEQNDLDHAQRVMQLACDHKSIAAIVAFAANHGDALCLGIALENEIRHAGAGILHERQ